jgi:hypothetical protein
MTTKELSYPVWKAKLNVAAYNFGNFKIEYKYVIVERVGNKEELVRWESLEKTEVNRNILVPRKPMKLVVQDREGQS